MRAAAFALVLVLTSCGESKLPLELATCVHKVEPDDDYRAGSYEFLKQVIGNHSIVGLGESLRMTRELPAAELHFIRYLHEEVGFDTLVLDASLVDVWLAEDYAATFNDPPETQVRHGQELALGAFDQTDAVAAIVAYAWKTQASARPLYLVGFGSRPGAGRVLQGPDALFIALDASLRNYVAPEDTTLESKLKPLLGRISDCESNGFPSSQAEASAALDALGGLEHWVSLVRAEAISRKRSASHVAALMLIPGELKKRVLECEKLTKAGPAALASEEGRTRARAVMTLLADVSATGRLILRTTTAALTYDSGHVLAPTLGEQLRAQVPDKLYAIGFFAGGGSHASFLRDNPARPLIRSAPSARHFSAESLLAGLGGVSTFIDLSKLDPKDARLSEWFVPGTARVEDSEQPTTLGADFSGAVFIPQTHAAWPTFVGADQERRARVLGFLVDRATWLLVALVALSGGIAFAVMRLRRRRAVTPPPADQK